MIRSEQINELAAALSKAQGEFPVIPKNKKVDFQPKQGPRVKYNYADLADVISITAPILSKHGLSISQDTTYIDKELFLETTIMHSSGQFKTGLYPVRMLDRPQEQGAELTYARRYTLSAALGIHSDEDTDGGAPNDLPPEERSNKKNETQKPVATKPQTPAPRTTFSARPQTTQQKPELKAVPQQTNNTEAYDESFNFGAFQGE